jgi:hypothetical protein
MLSVPYVLKIAYRWLLLMVSLGCGLVFAQTISSSVIGSVADPSGAVVPRATLRLANEGTGEVRSVSSDINGQFRFANMLPGKYRLTVRADGFKTHTSAGIELSASETRDLGIVALDIGSISDEVTVTTDVTPVQAASGEKSALVSGVQLSQIAIKGRDFLGMMNLLPGVIDTNSASRNASGNSGLLVGLHVNGGRTTGINLTVDGVTNLDTGSNTDVHFEPNMDAIGEVRVLTSNYQAEFGRSDGGVITVITKNGTQEFHGSGYWSHRHEEFNANDFFRNRTGQARAPYRFNIAGYSLGGPVFIPGKFNRSKTRLFFFVSQEWTKQRQDFGTRFVNMPTAAERLGDFSHSLDTNGSLIRITDALAAAPFPGNLVPASRINAIGQSMLNFLPKPNYVDSDPQLVNQRNYVALGTGAHPRRNDVVRIDGNPTDKLRAYWRFAEDTDRQDAPFGLFTNGSVNYDLTPVRLQRPGHGSAVHVTSILTPSLVNDFIFGKSYGHVLSDAVDPTALARSRMGNPPQWYPLNTAQQQKDYIPSVIFGGTPANAPNLSLGPIPYENYNNIWSFSDDLNKVWGRHNFKLGFYVEHTEKYAPVQGTNAQYAGTFNFTRNANNPFESGNSFANALLGNFQTYSETNGRAISDAWFWNVEFYLQDNWRVTSRLTLDFGLRLYHLTPHDDNLRQVAGFDPASYSLANAPRLYRPGKDATGKRVAVDPATSATAVAALIGLYVPGTGNPANGMRIGGVNGYPPGLYKMPGLSWGPRFGFAYDLTGKSKTVLRGGFGIFYNRPLGSQLSALIAGNPPVTYTPTLYYGTIGTFASTNGAIGPSSLNYPYGSVRLPTSMSYSLGVQHNLGFQTVVDVSYVGSQSRHLLWLRNTNPIPMFARFNPANADPTVANSPLPDDFLRPYVGWGNLNRFEFAGTSNYNSLQASVQHRFYRHLMLGVSYTWAKALGVASVDTGAVSPYFSPRTRNYGPLDYSVDQALAVNYLYEFPHWRLPAGGKLVSAVVNGWAVSGVTSLVAGLPFTPGFSQVNAVDLTGSTEGARINVVGNPSLPASQKSFYQNFNPAAFGPPAAGTFGNAGVNILRGPGVNNWDITVGRKFPVGLGENRYIDFRTEFYNVWNHTQFASFDTAARFDAKGAQVNGTFGAFNTTRPPRIIAFTLRFRF